MRLKSEQIALVTKHVVSGRAIIARQRRVIELMRARSADTRASVELLWTFEQSLAIFEGELARLENSHFESRQRK